MKNLLLFHANMIIKGYLLLDNKVEFLMLRKDIKANPLSNNESVLSNIRGYVRISDEVHMPIEDVNKYDGFDYNDLVSQAYFSPYMYFIQQFYNKRILYTLNLEK